MEEQRQKQQQIPSGMTERKARAKTKATAGLSAALRSAPDDRDCLIWDFKKLFGVGFGL
jgi:hypothetical protein